MINNKHKFIFLHIGKCAGSSIKSALNSSCEGCEYSNGHPTLDFLYSKILPTHSPSDYFKFSVTRNPWDRVVSLYHHMTTVTKRWPNNPEKRKIQFNGTFEEFVNKTTYVNTDYFELDYIIRYESLQHDFNIVCDRLNIKQIKLPCIDYDTGRPARNYQSYYNAKLQQIVAEKYAKDIEMFKYKFEVKKC